ncbi:MAG: ATPase [Verrucomicrobiota bacterium]|nr:ATPase [Verrucomicrobiota bacterium]
MTHILQAAVVLTTALLFVPAARAKVVSQSASGFMISHETDVSIDPRAAYDAFVEVGRWWNDSHSFSGAAKNISIDPKAGGCWCETLPNGGSVRHMTVVHANPAAMLVFNGGLGPLQFMGVAGSVQVTFKAKDSGTHVSVVYSVGGYDPDGFKEISKAVDAVLAQQVKRYGGFASTGKP